MALRVRRSGPKRDVLTAEQVGTAARTFGVLADPTRLRILHELTSGERSVGRLAQTIGISPSATSHQLSKLRDLGLVRARREGASIQYELANEHVNTFFKEALYHADHIVKGH
jgi:DNA-binding transcriptional ArsR family regulator